MPFHAEARWSASSSLHLGATARKRMRPKMTRLRTIWLPLLAHAQLPEHAYASPSRPLLRAPCCSPLPRVPSMQQGVLLGVGGHPLPHRACTLPQGQVGACLAAPAGLTAPGRPLPASLLPRYCPVGQPTAGPHPLAPLNCQSTNGLCLGLAGRTASPRSAHSSGEAGRGCGSRADRAAAR